MLAKESRTLKLTEFSDQFQYQCSLQFDQIQHTTGKDNDQILITGEVSVGSEVTLANKRFLLGEK